MRREDVKQTKRRLNVDDPRRPPSIPASHPHPSGVCFICFPRFPGPHPPPSRHTALKCSASVPMVAASSRFCVSAVESQQHGAPWKERMFQINAWNEWQEGGGRGRKISCSGGTFCKAFISLRNASFRAHKTKTGCTNRAEHYILFLSFSLSLENSAVDLLVADVIFREIEIRLHGTL